MATGDMVARLVLDGKEFELSLKKAKKGTKDFASRVAADSKKAGNSWDAFTSKVGEVTIAFAAAKGAIESVNESVKTLASAAGDLQREYEAAVAGVGAMWDQFLLSVTEWDWSNLEQRIGRVASMARNTAMQIATLNTLKPAEGYSEKLYEYNKAKAERIIKNPASTDAEVDEAIELLRQTINDYALFAADVREMNSLTAGTIASSLAEKYQPRLPQGVDQDLMHKFTGEILKDWRRMQEALTTDLTADYGNNAVKKAEYAAKRLVQSMTAEEVESITSLMTRNFELGKKMEDESRAMEELITKVYADRAKKIKDVAEAEKKAALEAEEFAEALKEMPWSMGQVRAMKLDAALSGGFTAENIAKTAKTPRIQGEVDLGVPGLPYYEGDYSFWRFNKNPIKSSGALAAMGEASFDWEGLQRLIADDRLKEWAEKNREDFDAWGASLDLLGGAFKSLGDSIGGTTGELLSFIGGLADAAQQMLPFIAQIMAETAAHEANADAAATEAAAKTMSAYAGIPFAGVGLGLAAVAAVVGAIQSVPKFAEGGIVTSATLGVFGEAGPEAVMPLDRLEEFVTGRDVRVTGNIKASGKELVVVLDNYNRVRNG